MTTTPDRELAPAATETTPSLPTASALSVSSTAAYRRDWQLFVDWCSAAGRQALPADADIVEAFLQKAGGAASSVRRYRAAIANAHHRAGHAAPETFRSTRRHPFPDVDVGGLLARIPVWGWPAGLFGRRDAMLIVARVQAGLTLAQTVGLTVDQVSTDDNQILHLAGVELPPTDDPRTCPACVWLRWRSMLQHFQRFTPAAVLARRLHRQGIVLEHRCATPPTRQVGTQQVCGPVLAPINQWGATPIPLVSATARTITTLTTAHVLIGPPRHPARTPPPEEQPVAEAPAAAVRVPLDTQTPAEVRAKGLAARRRDHHALRDVAADFDELDEATAVLQARLEELLGQAGQDVAHATAVRRW